MMLESHHERVRFSAMSDKVESLFDAWLSVEHHKVWEQMTAERQAREQMRQDEKDGINLAAPDMATMLESLRRMADMAEGAG